MIEKVSKIIVRGQNGDLLNVLPRTTSRAVAYGEGSVESELDRQDGKDVGNAETSVTSNTTTETAFIGTNKNFQIPNLMFGAKVDDGNGNVEYSILSPSNIASTNINSQYVNANTIYYVDFSLEFPAGGSIGGFGCNTFSEDVQNEKFYWFFFGYNDSMLNYAFPNWVDYEVANSSYTLWEGYESLVASDNYDDLSPMISIEWPSSIGETKTWRTNIQYTAEQIGENVYDRVETIIENSLDKCVEFSLTKTAENTYRLEFIIKLGETSTVSTTVKALQTSLELNDGTEISSETPISGLLQNVSVERKTDWICNPTLNSASDCILYVSISDAIETEPEQ